MMDQSVISCPGCGTPKTERMPTDACRIVHECAWCGMMIRPKPRDCCVFCSYGSVPCPPIQAERSGIGNHTSPSIHASPVIPKLSTTKDDHSGRSREIGEMHLTSSTDVIFG